VLPTHTPALFEAAVARASGLLKAGGLVALPTETVYGLAANALDSDAVARIFDVKGRPANNPVIVHVASLDLARQCALEWPNVADRLARAFWPGPLTMVLKRSHLVPNIVTAGGETVAIRWPSHPLMQSVIRACGFPLAAPSANISSEISPTNADHVRNSIGSRVPLIIDGGQCQVGIESTVVDLTGEPPRVLRPGMIHADALIAVTGKLANVVPAPSGIEPLRSPGLLAKHYAPKARLLILSWRDDADLISQLSHENCALSGIHVISHANIPSNPGFGRVSVIPHDAEAFARAIYAELHRCDEAGAKLILVEAPPESVEWHAVSDRLKRAAAS
jgi:L-threonylcarbamoyladenylate synthase